ncbi:hypothetical protein P7C70_g91, partial [Phenoliferia sp. Uapishka_3]
MSSSQSESPSNGTNDSGEEEPQGEWDNRPGPAFVAQAYARAYGSSTPLTSDPWNRPSPPVNGPVVSPYSIPLRDTQLHQQSSFPPSTFQHQPGPLGYPYPRPHLLASYGNLNPFMTSQLPQFSQAALGSQSGNSSPRPPPRPTSVPPWDGGRPSSSTNDSTTGIDFLDLIAKSANNVEMELDWDILNNGFNQRLSEGGTGFTPREGNSPRPEVENGVNEQQANNPPEISAPLLHIEETTSPQTYYSTLNAAPSQIEDALTVQDSAAESLLRLASHTPRESPEPEYSHSPSYAGDGEDKPRSSHQSHSPLDPWPLSYRPSPGREDILPSGRSRAQTPMKEYNEVPAAVPRLKEETRERILDHVREIATAHFDHSERFIPQLEPTFDSNDPSTSPSFLLLSVAAIGARYAWDIVKGASMYAHALSETARRLLQNVGDTDNTMMATIAWQQSHLLLLHAGLISGVKRDLERTQAFSQMPSTFCRRQGWLKERPVEVDVEATFGLEDRWRRWRDNEEIKRLGFAAIMLGGMGCAMWDFDAAFLYVDAARTSLPCHDALWEASSAPAWQSLFRGSILPARGIETLTAINQVSDRSLHNSEGLLAASRDTFAMAVTLTILHVLGASKLRETHSTSLFLPAAVQFEKSSSPVQAAIDAGLEFFENRVVLPPELQGLPDASASTSSMALMLHLTSMCQRLPLRILQAVARASTSSPSLDVHAWVRSWAAEDDGETARRTAWHAGQLVGLVRNTDTPLEPFALTYAALALKCYCTTRAGGSGASAPQTDEPCDAIELDKLVDRSDPKVVAWISTGQGDATLDGIGSLSDMEASEKVLRACGERLLALRVWLVGDLFGRTLLQLADESRIGIGGELLLLLTRDRIADDSTLYNPHRLTTNSLPSGPAYTDLVHRQMSERPPLSTHAPLRPRAFVGVFIPPKSALAKAYPRLPGTVIYDLERTQVEPTTPVETEYPFPSTHLVHHDSEQPPSHTLVGRISRRPHSPNPPPGSPRSARNTDDDDSESSADTITVRASLLPQAIPACVDGQSVLVSAFSTHAALVTTLICSPAIPFATQDPRQASRAVAKTSPYGTRRASVGLMAAHESVSLEAAPPVLTDRVRLTHPREEIAQSSDGAFSPGESIATATVMEVPSTINVTSTRSSSHHATSPVFEASPKPYGESHNKPLIIKLSIGRARSASVVQPLGDASSPRGKRIRKESRAIREQQESMMVTQEVEVTKREKKPTKRATREPSISMRPADSSAMPTRSTRAESVYSDRGSTAGVDVDMKDESFVDRPAVQKRRKSSGTSKLNQTCHHDKSRKDSPKMSCSNEDCSLMWCQRCIDIHYSGPTDPPFVAHGKFLCPVCRGNCVCAAHTRQRNSLPLRAPRKRHSDERYEGYSEVDGVHGESVVKRGKRRAVEAVAEVPEGFLGQLITVQREAPYFESHGLEDSSAHEMSEDESEYDSDDCLPTPGTSVTRGSVSGEGMSPGSGGNGPRLVRNVSQQKVWIEGPLRRDRKAEEDAAERSTTAGESGQEDAGSDEEIILFDLIDPELFPTLDQSQKAAASLPSPTDSSGSPEARCVATDDPFPLTPPADQSPTSSKLPPSSVPFLTASDNSHPSTSLSTDADTVHPPLPAPFISTAPLSPPLHLDKSPPLAGNDRFHPHSTARSMHSTGDGNFAHSTPVVTSREESATSTLLRPHLAFPEPPLAHQKFVPSLAPISPTSRLETSSEPSTSRPTPLAHESYKPSHYASSTPPTIHSHSRPQSTTPMMLVPAPSLSMMSYNHSQISLSQFTDQELGAEMRRVIQNGPDVFTLASMSLSNLLMETRQRQASSAIPPLASLSFYQGGLSAAETPSSQASVYSPNRYLGGGIGDESSFLSYAETEPSNFLAPFHHPTNGANTQYSEPKEGTPQFTSEGKLIDPWKGGAAPEAASTSWSSEWTGEF